MLVYLGAEAADVAAPADHDLHADDAWYQVWAVGAAGMLDVMSACYRSGDLTSFDLCEQLPYNFIQASQRPLYIPVSTPPARR